ncbi:Bmp and activin membrane-bound inhibitor homolog [Plakobranchus ocellatus]|uniref:Bmp and activin membrane-bound inhibitor homolog n=1 Tax=Plakobranchus ocellatus TaxID=259542 RepID=A0AAV4D142_9GAST|nr:Bmp and activin membrane-bound inhibitor homolog [Plakobranchus ocellatus]
MWVDDFCRELHRKGSWCSELGLPEQDAGSPGELRCHCNESGCVATGYMCKSQAGQCFTALEVRGEVTHLTHGCLDSLSEHHQALCELTYPDSAASPARQGSSPEREISAKRSSDPQPLAQASSPSETEGRGSGSSDSDNPDDDSNRSSSSGSNLSAGVHHHQQLQQQQQQQQQQHPPTPILLCCTEHMCNYREDADVTVNLLSKLNSSYYRGKFNGGAQNLK